MKKIIFVFSLFLLTSYSSLPQTQILRVGNAVQYWHDTSPPEIRLTIGTETINGKEYFIRKFAYYPYVLPHYYQITRERIEGDSLYFVLSSQNTDSLIFNFNWLPGTVVKKDTQLNVVIHERIDSIKIETTFMPDDTVYYLGIVGIDLISGDTLQVLPSINKIYKKFGSFYWGMWAIMEGVKIDGIRYGTVFPFPEEVSFSLDSIFVLSVDDTGSVYIVNNSDYELMIDSVISVGSFYGYSGCFSMPQLDFPFYLYQTLPNQWIDTLGIIIPTHDSVRVSFYDVDLCPVCDSHIEDYFIDTLRFVFRYKYYQNYEYRFSLSIQISGEGHPSTIEETIINLNEFVLYQNYPNPFNPSTSIQYVVGSGQFVQLKVYDVLGNEIAILVNEEKPAGSYEVNFKASKLSSGIYFYKLQAGSFFETKKMILLR